MLSSEANFCVRTCRTWSVFCDLTMHQVQEFVLCLKHCAVLQMCARQVQQLLYHSHAGIPLFTWWQPTQTFTHRADREGATNFENQSREANGDDVCRQAQRGAGDCQGYRISLTRVPEFTLGLGRTSVHKHQWQCVMRVRSFAWKLGHSNF